MGGRRKGKRAGSLAGEQPYDTRDGIALGLIQAVDGNVVDGAGAAISKAAEVLSDGGNALGGLAKAGLRAVGAVKLDTAAGAVAEAAGSALSGTAELAGTAAGAAGQIGSAAASLAGDLAGPALEAAGEAAGAALGAVIEGAADILSP